MTNYWKHKLRSKSPAEMIGAGIIIAIIITVLVIGFGYVVMYLWNWLMPAVFGLTTITFWQAIGLGLLSKLLFGGFSSNKGKEKSRRKCESKRSQKSDFSKWKHYDSFWQEEGEKAYQEYIKKQETPEEPTTPENE
jgi:predicted tellurium resistance membrane protein TerC